ncbi:type IV toxin-antitoxin system AbiEi family antitoxin domain-containing protein [Methylomonas paludis]|uniref:Type IV toxin-antitoxin system AbiEi family antitoxin domain-containing protein n=2 Tax=Methylomonas paludis TaxID=1173101 RepID=A0A975RB07_9GAMM|nr:type IV toxin-antitoxin system AbiEi family antitoxin domain-containing protein [Methylomonas paludis]
MPLTTAFLSDHGLSPKHASYLAKHGWLLRLGRGAYMLPGDKLSKAACLNYIFSLSSNIHVGGKTALDWHGVRHNLVFKEIIELWSISPLKLPDWLTTEYPCRTQVTQIFDDALPLNYGLSPLHDNTDKVLVSTKERAVLELLSDAGKNASLELVNNLLENTRNLREDKLEVLFFHVNRIKVARLAYQLAEDLDLPWKELAKKHCLRLGGGKRWVAKTKTGERLDLRNG